MGIDVGAPALKASARSHCDAVLRLADDSSGAAALLLFYAAECGLKAILLTRSSLRDTGLLRSDLRSHDLRRMIKELRLPPTIDLAESYRCASSQQQESRIAPKELHEAWRYGKNVKADDHTAAVASLRAILDWCEKERGK